jgi:monoamine oxidase
MLGACPTGLGAARRLEELGHKDWLLLEGASQAGGDCAFLPATWNLFTGPFRALEI